MTDVAVVIGSYRSESLLPECIASLRAQTLEPVEIVAVDGSSPDASAETAERLGVRTLVVENRGLGFLYNRGAESVTAPYVLLTNPDVAFAPDCLGLLASALDGDETLFAADPRQDGWGQDDGVVHTRTTLARGRLFHELLPGFHLDLKAPADRQVSTVSANGGAMLVRRERLLELGGFDETFFMDFEDLDLCWRAWLRGWGSVHVPQARLRHRVGGSTAKEILPARYAQSHHNLMRFALKCLPARDALGVVAAEVLRLGVHPRLVAPALARVARTLPEILRARREVGPRRDLLDWFLAGQP